MKTDCFAYRKEKYEEDGLHWIIEYCDALEDKICNKKQCPFYKPINSVKIVYANKQIRYEELK